MLIDCPWMTNAPIPPSNEPLLVCASRAGNIGACAYMFYLLEANKISVKNAYDRFCSSFVFLIFLQRLFSC
jgi:hypothetical protein